MVHYCNLKVEGQWNFLRIEVWKIINSILYVPNLTQNLVNVNQLLHNSYYLNFKNLKYVIYDPKGCEVANISMFGNSVTISCYSDERYSFNVELSDTCLWHKTFGHHTLSSLAYMQLKSMVLGVPKIDMFKMFVTHVNLWNCIDNYFLKGVFGGQSKS